MTTPRTGGFALLLLGLCFGQDTKVASQQIPLPTIRVDIDHSPPRMSAEAGIKSIVNYGHTDVEINTALVAAVCTNLAKLAIGTGKVSGKHEDTLESTLAASTKTFKNAEVSVLFTRPLVGTAYAGSSGMSIGGNAIAVGKTVRNPDIDPQTKARIKGTGKEVGYTSGAQGAHSPVRAQTGEGWDRITIAPQFSANQKERERQKVTIFVAAALAAGGRSEATSRVVEDVERRRPDQIQACLQEFQAAFAESRQKRLLKAPLSLVEKILKDGYEKAPGTVAGQATFSFAGKIMIGKQEAALTIKPVTADINKGAKKEDPKFHPQTLEETKEDCAEPEQGAGKSFVVISKTSDETVTIRAFGVGAVEAQAVHRAMTRTRLQTYFVVVWAAVLEAGGEREVKLGAHLHWTGLDKPPKLGDKDASEEAQVVELLKAEVTTAPDAKTLETFVQKLVEAVEFQRCLK